MGIETEAPVTLNCSISWRTDSGHDLQMAPTVVTSEPSSPKGAAGLGIPGSGAGGPEAASGVGRAAKGSGEGDFGEENGNGPGADGFTIVSGCSGLIEGASFSGAGAAAGAGATGANGVATFGAAGDGEGALAGLEGAAVNFAPRGPNTPVTSSGTGVAF
jgi:hypothetical protein